MTGNQAVLRRWLVFTNKATWSAGGKSSFAAVFANGSYVRRFQRVEATL